MRRQISAPAYENRRPSDVSPRPSERPASATSRPGVPPRPSVPPPSSNRSTRSPNPYFADKDGIQGLIREQEVSLEFLLSEINKKQADVNHLKTEVSKLEWEVAKDMPTRTQVKATSHQIDTIRNLWNRQRSLSVDCQYWTLAVDSFGDHYLGDVNCTRSQPRTSSTAPPLPQKPSPKSMSSTRRAPFNELDQRVPLQKDYPAKSH